MENPGDAVVTCATTMDREWNPQNETAVATSAETGAGRQGHGGALNMGRFDEVKNASAIMLRGIMQWCMPFLRQHAGKAASCCAVASSG